MKTEISKRLVQPMNDSLNKFEAVEWLPTKHNFKLLTNVKP